MGNELVGSLELDFGIAILFDKDSCSLKMVFEMLPSVECRRNSNEFGPLVAGVIEVTGCTDVTNGHVHEVGVGAMFSTS